jgi:hypothetical protein
MPLKSSREAEISPERWAEQAEEVRRCKREKRCSHTIRWWDPCGKPAVTMTRHGPRCAEHLEPA